MQSSYSFINVPIFKPNENQFKDFYGLIRQIETSAQFMEAGLAKICPPVNINPKNVRSDYILKNCVIQNTTELASGIYTIDFGNKASMSSKEFRDIAKSSHVGTEDSFWAEILNRNAATYAIDNEKSLYPENGMYWSMSSLNQSIIHDTAYKFPGINTPFVNFGMCQTAFGLHIEDSSLASINVLHGGSPKFWYGIPFSNAPKLERVVKLYTPKNIPCDMLIRHKSILIPPSALEMNKIKFSKVVQEAGEIIVTAYGAYHQGMNLGFNFCESTNYATAEWLKYYDGTKNCSCESYGTKARERHLQLGGLIETWKNTNQQTENLNKNHHHWVDFDKKTSRTRCKMSGCKGFTHSYCTKCEIHLCCSVRRNCYLQYHTK